MSTLIHSGEFGLALANALAAALARRQPGEAATLLDARQCPGAPGSLEGQVFALFSSLRLDLMQALAGALAPAASLFCGFAFERHVLLAPPCSAQGVCAQCFARRLLSQPPEPYSAETLFFLSRLAATVDTLAFRGYHPGLVDLAAQLCLLQADGQFAPTTSILIDSAGVGIYSSQIMPLHGCTCRSPGRSTCAGPQRFAAFGKELDTWIA